MTSMPMRRPDGRWVNLVDLLNLIPGDDLSWSFLEFEGVGGEGPRGESIIEFEELIRTSRAGYVLSWPELVRFAGQLKQVINCYLVASGAISGAGGDAEAEFVIEAIGSTTWEIQAVDQELSRRLLRFAADRAG
jgi:hypothetical protein